MPPNGHFNLIFGVTHGILEGGIYKDLVLSPMAMYELRLEEHQTGRTETIQPGAPGGGHGGGDVGIMRAFLDTLRGDGRPALTSAAEALDSHLLAFAAEEARVTQRVVDTSHYWQLIGAHRP